MDNGSLVFIIMIEAIIIVWLASKLKQYQKFEHLLDRAGSAQTVQAANSPVANQSSTPQPSSDSANAATRAVAGSVTASGASDEELLEMPGVDPEGNIEEAKRVQLVMARCRYAEFYLEQLDDDYERSQFQKIVNSCKATARNINDPFFRASALQPIIILLDKAEWPAERDELLGEVEDEFVKEQVILELKSVATA